MKKRMILLLVALALAVLLIVFFYYENNAVTVTQIEYESDRLPESFDGFRIVQLSDVHNKKFDDRFFDMVHAEHPDIIAITGDLIDSRRTDTQTAYEFVRRCQEIAQVYYVTGNHEYRLGIEQTAAAEIQKLGGIVLDNTFVDLTKGANRIRLVGLQGELPDEDHLQRDVTDRLLELKSDGFNLLLAHRPDHVDYYAASGIDLALTGHVHGGQIRLPFIGGVYGPGQGFFPKYCEGIYRVEDTSMVVSRGLGNSLAPLRVFNRPEIVSVTLKQSKGV